MVKGIKLFQSPICFAVILVRDDAGKPTCNSALELFVHQAILGRLASAVTQTWSLKAHNVVKFK